MEKINETLFIMFNSGDSKIKIGELSKYDNKYYFKYDIEGAKKASEFGFEPFPNFPRINAQYFREEIFSCFKERIAGDNLDDEELFDIIKSTGARLAEDNLEFVLDESTVAETEKKSKDDKKEEERKEEQDVEEKEEEK